MFNTLCVGSGGFKGFGMLALLNSRHAHELPYITHYVGSSIGAVICLFLSMGLTPDEIILLICTQDHLTLFNNSEILRSVARFLDDGCDEAASFFSITFSSLYAQTGATLVVTTLKVPDPDSTVDFETVYYTHQTHGDKLVFDAVCESMHILPNESNIDGGYGDNFPFSYAKLHLQSPVLGVYTMDRNEARYINYRGSGYLDELVKVLNFMERYIVHIQMRLIQNEKLHAEPSDKIECFVNRDARIKFHIRPQDIIALYNR